MSKSTPSPKDRLADTLAAFFRSISGSSDRELANEAIQMEPKVLEFVRGVRCQKRSPSKRPLVAA